MDVQGIERERGEKRAFRNVLVWAAMDMCLCERCAEHYTTSGMPVYAVTTGFIDQWYLIYSI